MGFMDWLKGLGGKKSSGDSDKVVVNHEEQVATAPPPAPAPDPTPPAPASGDEASKRDTV